MQSLLIHQNLHISWIEFVCHLRSWIRFLEHQDGAHGQEDVFSPSSLRPLFACWAAPCRPSPGTWSHPLRYHPSGSAKRPAGPDTRGWGPLAPNPAATLAWVPSCGLASALWLSVGRATAPQEDMSERESRNKAASGGRQLLKRTGKPMCNVFSLHTRSSTPRLAQWCHILADSFILNPIQNPFSSLGVDPGSNNQEEWPLGSLWS